MELLALSGGGSNGAWQAGVAYSLWKKRYRPDVVAGTSVGALNAALVATGQIDKMAQIWQGIDDSQVRKARGNFRLLTNHLIHKIGIRKPILAKWSNAPLKRLLREAISGTVTEIPLYVSSVRVGNGTPDRYIGTKIPAGTHFTEENVDRYVDIIVASTAIPIAFEPVRIGDDLYFDGGLHHSTPIYEAINNEDIEHLTAICCSPLQNLSEHPTDLIEIAQWTLETLLAHRFFRDWQEFERWNEAALQADLEIDGRKVRHIKNDLFFPDTDLGNALDFSNEKARSLFRQGVLYND